MSILEIAKIQVRRGQENQEGVPQLDPGEFGWAQDTEHLYIGKRIVEGAADDNNSRILTENDLDNIFSLLEINNTATIISPYQYRANVTYISANTEVRFLQDKLDETVSLADFGIVPSFTATDITAQFQVAVNTIFNNSTWDSFERTDSRRKLIVPAGNYIISQTVLLPPYAVLQGESPELTKLTLLNVDTNIFKTVDADGNEFETNDMRSGVKRARGVHISDMTLEYNVAGLSSAALISLDNVMDATIDNCVFRTEIDPATTTTFGLVNLGVGIEIRGSGGGIGSGDTNLCENVFVTRCKFDSIGTGVRSTGTVIKPVISNSVFTNLYKGVEMYTIDTLPGPSNGHISDNRFENIVLEGVYIGPNPNMYRSEHVVSNNYFVQVGNGEGLDDFITESRYSIMVFDAPGNKAVNNYFYRKFVADNTLDESFYYSPLVSGRVMIEDGATTTATVVAASTTNVTKIPLNGQDQFLDIRYQLTNASLSRKGTIILNIAPDGFSAVTDNFNFIESLEEGSDSPEIYFEGSGVTNNYINLRCVNTSIESVIEYQINTVL